ncbi:type I inositol 1,4,5-trisphosphate 5-phosphatase isoform X1 [Drosophila serrata]|uniref:type I inositol 1,4,5-trisphosphate 5-phosphatase isoform X1 n=1 Tax=Drosophila serrata TaxID=7274 RepID=UPI000A1D0FB7|nr:type I inositol 1,4,5-trisphosphate 5-phosphatase isoform X1 [Drosophila serrata]
MEAAQEDGLSTDVLLVTANVGSLFEDPDRLLQLWLHEFLAKVSHLQPRFLALHLQEVGGKTYEKSMEYVQEFIKCLCDDPEMGAYTCVHIFMDEDFKSAEHFTALGSLYFVHQDVASLKLWNFLTHSWEESLSDIKDKHIYSGNIETIATKEKSKFPQHFFPECKWSRKGFMRTRWEINGTVIDLVNIHLFHDASNLAACENFPSVYCKTRRRALVHTIERFHLDEQNGTVPFFLFGDFNFRCDTEGVVKELTQNLTAHRVQNIKNENDKIHYRNSTGDNVLTVGKKEFSHADHQLKFKEDWLKKFDRELEPLKDVLVEYPIQFIPSYPFEEDPEMPTDYMSTRCPAWCDRILMSPQVHEIIRNDEWTYGMIGEGVCMGDHKPVYLTVRLKQNKGTYRSCDCNDTHTTYAKPNEISTSTPPPLPAVKLNYYCPYSNKLFEDIATSSKLINETEARNMYNSLKISHNEAETAAEATKANCPNFPNISINIIDSDNICMCLCAHLSSNNLQFDDSNNRTGEAICPMCRNIIKRQPVAHRYKLLSKRLMLTQEIIINRIDTQHLSTDSERLYEDPYTPESTESHSPYPEVTSSCTSTSSSSRSPFDRRLMPHDRISESKVGESEEATSPPGLETGDTEIREKSSRGTVTPGQLKSRLETLKRLSIKDENDDRDNDDDDDDEAGRAGDVDRVETPNAATAPTRSSKRNSSVIPMCCTIH